MPGDGGAPLEGGGLPPDQAGTGSQTTQVLSGGNGAFLGLSQTVLDTIIEFLEAKV